MHGKPGPRSLQAVLLLAALLWTCSGAALLAAPAASSLVGTYKIDSWRSLESRGLYHFFYLDPSGVFLLAADWPRNELSRIGGTWSLAQGLLTLRGLAQVNTSEGTWEVPFHRAYRVTEREGRPHLEPLPEKNRYGMMGWPDGYQWFSARPQPNLPDQALPADPERLRALIHALWPGEAPLPAPPVAGAH